MVQSKARPCPAHGDVPAIARCQGCGLPMCPVCWVHNVDGQPWCEPCIALLARPAPAIAYVGVAAATAGLGGLALRSATWHVGVRWGLWAFLALIVSIAAYRLYHRANRQRQRRSVAPRPVAADDARFVGGGPYRGGLRRAARAVAPPVSGRLAALVVIAIMALTAGAVPVLLQLPRWLETELILLAWWAVWTGTFTVLLFRGWRISQDMRGLSKVATGEMEDAKRSAKSLGNALSKADLLSGCADHEGCLVAVAVVVGLGVTIAAAWFLAELLVPVLLVGAYWLVIRGLARVANDRHGCEGKAAPAALWGLLWATLYTGPLAVLVWLAHEVLARRG